MLVGFHLSIGKGFAGAVDSAEELGVNALQIFSHNAASWRMKPIPPAVAAAFRARTARSSIEYLVVHSMYLINLASPDDALFARSVAALTEEVARAGRLGIAHVVTHLGAHRGAGRAAGIARIIDGLNRVIASEAFVRFPAVRILLENTAGTGTTIGTSFAELGEIIASLTDPSRIGVCLDTCHAFAAGYELRTGAGLESTLAEFDRAIGLERLELIHLNDSVYPLGSHRDRHAHIGRGEIGDAGIAGIVNHPDLRELPFILETPKEIAGQGNADRINLYKVRSLRQKSRRKDEAIHRHSQYRPNPRNGVVDRWSDD